MAATGFRAGIVKSSRVPMKPEAVCLQLACHFSVDSPAQPCLIPKPTKSKTSHCKGPYLEVNHSGISPKGTSQPFNRHSLLHPPYTTCSSRASSDENVPTMFATAALRLEAAEAALHHMTRTYRVCSQRLDAGAGTEHQV